MIDKITTILGFIKLIIIPIIVGLIVYFFTRKRAQLTYYFSNQTSFSQKKEGKSEKITFQNLTIKNSGNNTATEITIILDGSFLNNNSIEYDINTIEQHEKITDEKGNITIKYKRMLPKDTFTISFLQRSNNTVEIDKNIIISGRCNEAVAIDEKKYTSPSDWIKYIILYGMLIITIYAVASLIIKENYQNTPKSKIDFTVDTDTAEKGDTINISTYIQNNEKQVITNLWWHINTSTFGLYEVDSINSKMLNPNGFYREAILDTSQSEIRYGIVIVPFNIPSGKYYFTATCIYDVNDVQKQKRIKDIINVK